MGGEQVSADIVAELLAHAAEERAVGAVYLPDLLERAATLIAALQSRQTHVVSGTPPGPQVISFGPQCALPFAKPGTCRNYPACTCGTRQRIAPASTGDSSSVGREVKP